MLKLKNENAVYQIIAFVIAVAVGLAGLSVYAQSCENLRTGVLRLHVVANSDSDDDQRVKLLVRDEILKTGAACFADAADAEQAAARVQQNAQALLAAADSVLRAENMPYSATLCIEREYFDTRSYGDVTLPAGTYLAVRVVLGAGAGHNWWCVMFPPLCLPAATEAAASTYAVFGEANAVVSGESGYAVRFRLVELWEQLRAAYVQRRENARDEQEKAK